MTVLSQKSSSGLPAFLKLGILNKLMFFQTRNGEKKLVMVDV
jgi:hypothetical protein